MELDGRVRYTIVTKPSGIYNYFKWIREIHPYEQIVFGVDAELIYESTGRGEPEVEMLNICSAFHECAFVLVKRLREIPDVIKNFLSAPDIIKVGLGIADQLEALERTCDVRVESSVDVRHLADEEGFQLYNPQTLPWILGEQAVPRFAIHRKLKRMDAGQLTSRSTKVTTYARVFQELTRRKAIRTYKLANWEVHRNDTMTRSYFHFWSKYFNLPFDYTKSRYTTKRLIDLRLELADTSNADFHADEMDSQLDEDSTDEMGFPRDADELGSLFNDSRTSRVTNVTGTS